MSDKPQYTPGPWNPSRNYIVNAARGLEADRRGESWKDRHGEFEDTVADNANLIAAAPELYKAFERIIETANIAEMPPTEKLYRIIEIATGATKKARGE